MQKNDTIAAIATAPGVAGIAVIRVSGEEAITLTSKIFRSCCGKNLQEAKTHTVFYGDILDKDNSIIDDALVTVFRSPKSYTGENVVEVSVHGGKISAKKVLETLFSQNIRPALPGEFTKRALLSGKLTLTQAEAITDIIFAENKEFLKIAQFQKNGSLFRKINRIASFLKESCSLLAADIDFSENGGEDISPSLICDIFPEINKYKEQLSRLLEEESIISVLKNGLNVAIIGKPNVGKSSILNLIVGYSRSIVTDIPGTTRDIIEETAIINGISLNFADCAGLRKTENIVEKIGIDLMQEKAKLSSLLISVFDQSLPFSEEDSQILDILNNSNSPFIVIVNKTDLPKNPDFIIPKIKNTKVVYISAENENSREILLNSIKDILDKSFLFEGQCYLASERQKKCVVNAVNALSNLENAPLDAVFSALTLALDSLYELTGENVSSAIIDEVFSRFCIGK